MLQAIVHGKLSPDEERMEDLLTSSVFGIMKYLPPDVLLLPFLSKAWDPLSRSTLREWLSDVTAVESSIFWPEIVMPGCIACEPDVQFLLKNGDGGKTWLLVEVKYRSGKSSKARPLDKRPNDQLARQYDNLAVMAGKEKIKRFAVVYLTAHVLCPIDDVRESVREYEDKRGHAPRFFWLSWRMLADALEYAESEARVFGPDLRELLQYLELTMYKRLRVPQFKRLAWKFAGLVPKWRWSLLTPAWRFDAGRRTWLWASRALPSTKRFWEPTAVD